MRPDWLITIVWESQLPTIGLNWIILRHFKSEKERGRGGGRDKKKTNKSIKM